MRFPILIFAPLFFFIFSCTLPPTKPITLEEMKRLKIDVVFRCENSLEEVMRYLNKDGAVVFECMSKRRPVEPYYIKVLATPTGPHVMAFPKSEYVD